MQTANSSIRRRKPPAQVSCSHGRLASARPFTAKSTRREKLRIETSRRCRKELADRFRFRPVGNGGGLDQQSERWNSNCYSLGEHPFSRRCQSLWHPPSLQARAASHPGLAVIDFRQSHRALCANDRVLYKKKETGLVVIPATPLIPTPQARGIAWCQRPRFGQSYTSVQLAAYTAKPTRKRPKGSLELRTALARIFQKLLRSAHARVRATPFNGIAS